MANFIEDEVMIGKCDIEIVGLCSEIWYECKLLLKENILTYQRSHDHRIGKPIDLQKCLLYYDFHHVPDAESGYCFELCSRDLKQKWRFRSWLEQNRNHIVHKLSKQVIGTKVSQLSENEKILFMKHIPEGADKLRTVLLNAVEVIPFSHIRALSDRILTPSFINAIKRSSKLGHISGILLWIYYLSNHRMKEYTIFQTKNMYKLRLTTMSDTVIEAMHSIEHSMDNIAQFIMDLDSIIEALLDIVDCIDEENTTYVCKDCCQTLVIWQQLFLSQQDIELNKERVFFGLINEVQDLCRGLVMDSKDSTMFGWQRPRSHSINSTVSTSSTLTKTRTDEV